MEYLKAMGLNTGFAKTSLRSGITRPCFSPNGQIAFVSGSKIKIVQTTPVDAATKAPTTPFSPASTVLNFTQVEKKNDQSSLDNQMERMNLS